MQKRTTKSKLLFNKKHLPKRFSPPIIIADQIKTPENIGNIIRLADNIGCMKVIIVSDEDDIRLSKIRKTAGLSFDSMPWEICRSLEVFNKIPEGYILVSLETTSDSTSIYKTELPLKIAFVVGNEIVGVNSKILDSSDLIVNIPIYGNNSSLNVSHALAVALFEWQRQISNKE